MASVLTSASIHTCTHTQFRERERLNSVYFRGILVCLPGTANLTGLTVHSSFFLSHTNSCSCPPISISSSSILQVLLEGRLWSSQKPFFHLLLISKQTADPAALTLKTPRIQPLPFTSDYHHDLRCHHLSPTLLHQPPNRFPGLAGFLYHPLPTKARMTFSVGKLHHDRLLFKTL